MQYRYNRAMQHQRADGLCTARAEGARLWGSAACASEQEGPTSAEVAPVLVICHCDKGPPKGWDACSALIVWAAQEMLPAAPDSLLVVDIQLKLPHIWCHIHANVLHTPTQLSGQ